MQAPEVTLPAEKHQALTQLLASYGPYRRDQLRLKLLSKAALLRDEADAEFRAQNRFARLGRGKTNPRPQPLADASELELMAKRILEETILAHQGKLQQQNNINILHSWLPDFVHSVYCGHIGSNDGKSMNERWGRVKVLLVEGRATSMRGDLESGGFAVSEVSTVGGALGELERDQFDLVVTDVGLPALDGLSLLREMKARSLDTPACLVFERADNASALEAASLGALQCLVRPVDAASLKRIGELAVAMRPRGSEKSGVPPFHSRLRGTVVPKAVSATEAKNEFGHVLDTAMRSGAVVITRHASPRAVLLAMDEFEELVGEVGRRLDTLSSEFDGLLARMQAPGARERMKAAFGASSSELGEAAVKAAAKQHG